MPIDIDPTADPNHKTRCPRRLLGDGPRCRALVLVGDAEEHSAYHDRLDELLESPVASVDELVEWPERAASTPNAPTPGL